MTKISALLVAVAFAAAPASAMAQTAACSAAFSDGFCHTDNIPANGQFHFVHVDVHGPSDLFTVVDRENGIIVYQSNSGWGGRDHTVGGLYGSYSVYLYGGVWPVTNVTLTN